MFNQKSLKRLHWVLWVAVGTAAAVSIAINLIHASLAGNRVSFFIAPWPPIMVVFSAEVINRIPFNAKAPWYRKYPRLVSMIGLAGACGYLSYLAQRAAILHYTGDVAEGWVLPLCIDGFMIIMSISSYEVNERLFAIQAAKRNDSEEAEKPVRARRNGSYSRKEQVALLLDRNPKMTPTEIAKAVGCSVSYASTLRTELKQANGAELVGAATE